MEVLRCHTQERPDFDNVDGEDDDNGDNEADNDKVDDIFIV